MDKRYQVFFSSTYVDLQAERQQVMQALLELDCIPSGMELFPAADDDQWNLIKQVIDDCDYYLVIIGGRYGSTGKDGKSYTQMEYEYAVSKDKPVLAFLHRNPGSIAAEKSEETSEGKIKLKAFRELAERKMCKYWASPEELGSVVSRSVVKLMKSRPAVGWVRADLVPDETASKEILKLKKQVEELQSVLESARTSSPAGTSDLAQGDESLELTFRATLRGSGGGLTTREYRVATTWNEVFSVISPLMIDKASEQQLGLAIREYFGKRDSLVEPGIVPFSLALINSDLQKVKLQFRALGLITKDTSQKSLKDTSTYWTLTPYGDSLMTKSNASRSNRIASVRPEAAPSAANEKTEQGGAR
jgi:hypothetical protein